MTISFISQFSRKTCVIALLAAAFMGFAPFQIWATPSATYAQKLMHGRYFAHGLEWVGEKAPDERESHELWQAFGGDNVTSLRDCADALTNFVKARPDSPWAPCLEVNLGNYDNERGLFSLALEQWEAAWNRTKGLKDREGTMLADAALVNWLQLLASLGRTDTMKSLFDETKGRHMGRLALTQYNGLRLAYSHMMKHPEDSYRCGTYALSAVTQALYGTNSYWGLMKERSPATGFSMAELVQLAESNHLGLAAVERPSGTELVVPSVVHWKENHYAAIVGEKGDLYDVVDPTFRLHRWLTAEAINHESSGQFMVPANRMPAGWKKLEMDEAGRIFGKGYPAGNVDPPPGPPCCIPCGCSPGSGGTKSDGGTGAGNSGTLGTPGVGGLGTGIGGASMAAHCSTCSGMPTWNVVEPDVSLWLQDEPLEYQTATDGRFSFQLAFNEQFYSYGPGSDGFAFLSLGGWACPWMSYIDAFYWASDSVTLYPLGGGGGAYTVYTNLTGTVPEFYSNNRMLMLTNSDGTPASFKVFYPSGAVDVYGATSVGWSDDPIFYLSERIDALGRGSFFYYDTSMYMDLTNVVDADGMTNTLTYTEGAWGPQMTSVQDPYGHQVTLAYDSWSGFLTNIVDANGLSTTFSYDVSGALTNMVTPYGTNGFQFNTVASTNDVDISYQYVIIREFTGAQQMFLYAQGDDFAGVPKVYTDTNNVPTSRPAGSLLDNPDWNNPAANDSMNLANSFYWNREQFNSLSGSFQSTYNFDDLTTNDYALARLRHWNQNSSGGQGRTLSMERQPSPNGVTAGKMAWWDYPGKPEYNVQGTSAFPSLEILVLPDGTEQYKSYQVDGFGNRTNIISTYSIGGSVFTRTNRYVYSGNGVDLLQAIGADGVTNAAYGYNAYHNPLFFTNAVGDVTGYSYNAYQQVTGITQPTGLITTNIYYSTNRLKATYDYAVIGPVTLYFGTNSYTYSNDLVFSRTDERGLVTTNQWDGLERLTNVSYPDGTALSYTYRYLDVAQMVDRMGFTTSYGYNAIRQKISETNALGNVTLYGYCDCGALSEITNALGQVTQLVHDNQGNLTCTIYPDGYQVTNIYNSVKQLAVVADSAGVRTTNTFNNQGLVMAVSNAFGLVQSTGFDINDRATNRVDANGVTTTNSYDNLGRVLVRGVVGGGVEDFAYSPSGLTFYTNQLGFVAMYGYDAKRRKTAETNADGQVTQYAYSAAGDLTGLTDGKSDTTQWGYDLYGRVTNKVDATGTTILKYSYDADNRLTSRWSLGKTNAIYSYDQAGNLTSVTYQASSSLTFAYDAMNRLTNMTDGIGATAFTYTLGGQLASEDGPWASDAVSYAYSNRRRAALDLEQPTADDWVQNYGYDAANRLTSVTGPSGTFTYTYDSGLNGATASSGLIDKLALPNGGYIANLFDGLARLTNSALYNSGGTALDATGYVYNNANQRTRQIRGAGSQNTNVYTYDNIGQVIGDVSAEGTTNRMNEQLHYGYDAAGNLNYRTNNTLVENFQVNSVNELTAGTNGGRLTVVGTTTSMATNVTVNGTNALLYGDATFAATNLPLTGSYSALAKDSYGRRNTNTVTVSLSTNTTFQYDLNGNLTNDGLRSFAYDDENQLTQVWVSTQWKSQFAYDGKMRRRVRQEYTWQSSAWVETNEVRYIYDGNLVIQERNVNNLPTTTYTRGNDLSGSLDGAGGIGGLLARTDAATSQPAFYYSDGNGNVRMMISTSNLIVAKYIYDAFGNTLSAAGSQAQANLYRFSGKEAHPNSGLVYYLYRYYDPNLQRWPNRDPIRELGHRLLRNKQGVRSVPYDVKGLNLYEFAQDDPVDTLDSFGLNFASCFKNTLKAEGGETITSLDLALFVACVLGCAAVDGGVTVVPCVSGCGSAILGGNVIGITLTCLLCPN